MVATIMLCLGRRMRDTADSTADRDSKRILALYYFPRLVIFFVNSKRSKSCSGCPCTTLETFFCTDPIKFGWQYGILSSIFRKHGRT